MDEPLDRVPPLRPDEDHVDAVVLDVSEDLLVGRPAAEREVDLDASARGLVLDRLEGRLPRCLQPLDDLVELARGREALVDDEERVERGVVPHGEVDGVGRRRGGAVAPVRRDEDGRVHGSPVPTPGL